MTFPIVSIVCLGMGIIYLFYRLYVSDLKSKKEQQKILARLEDKNYKYPPDKSFVKFEKSRTYLRQQGFKEASKENCSRIEERLNKVRLFQGYIRLELKSIFKIEHQCWIGIIKVDYNYDVGESRFSSQDYQLIGILPKMQLGDKNGNVRASKIFKTIYPSIKTVIKQNKVELEYFKPTLYLKSFDDLKVERVEDFVRMLQLLRAHG